LLAISVCWAAILLLNPFSYHDSQSESRAELGHLNKSMTEFDDIRSYNDEEVRPTLDRLLNDPELSHAVASLKFPRLTQALPWLICPLVKTVLKHQLKAVNSVRDLQLIVKKYMDGMINKTVSSLTHSGLDKLDPNKAYLFVSNHRDIAMDPAFVNWVLFVNGFETLRIAIGDNLLTKPYVSDLMRLNRSFIVNRSATAPRAKLKAAKHLSAYIHHSIVEDNAHIWIAQREGRAKDGLDRTNTAIVSMFALSKPKTTPFADYINELNIVPVSISYEVDPCDSAKARELHAHRTEGSYQKEEHEDVASIAAGIAGEKGHVHVAFGEVLRGDFDNADQVVEKLDRQIIENYVLHPSNCFAYQTLYGKCPPVNYSERDIPFDEQREAEAKAALQQRLDAIPERYRDIVLAMYANPINSKLELQNSGPVAAH